ncbi:tetratricopeptide repeat protein [Acidithiobacillus sulfurivorans]|jgi:hypothetical protein|uniref:Sel1 repeat family protein n=1 Tax=Acidithiobacillus sulfurivorans TaxID=1958756 RepID=A0ABS5ZWW1_9PROT|nr:tetratricopeptide repeat protein [Acidithiobacillus sulfurivorans]MBU2759722.1 sel1 repeat family protein [Acidithiobacillus sulfurivorans]
MIVLPRVKFLLFATIFLIFQLLSSFYSPVYAFGNPGSPWPAGPNLTYAESKVLALSAYDGYNRFLILKKSAQEGNAKAMMGLSIYYQNIHQPQKALFWARKSAHAGNPHAESFLGLAYYHGDGVAKNQKKAIYWLEKAASQHDYAVEYFLARLHQHGKGGFPKNVQAAIPLYESAAHDGSILAAEELAEIYKNPHSPLYNQKLADHWEHFIPEKGLGRKFTNASNEFQMYQGYGSSENYKKHQKFLLQKNHLYFFFLIFNFIIIWVATFFQIRKSWQYPEGSSLIFWGTSALLNFFLVFFYLLSQDLFLFLFYTVTTILFGIIIFVILFRKRKKKEYPVIPVVTNTHSPDPNP